MIYLCWEVLAKPAIAIKRGLCKCDILSLSLFDLWKTKSELCVLFTCPVRELVVSTADFVSVSLVIIIIIVFLIWNTVAIIVQIL